jgi:hypothetical protein
MKVRCCNDSGDSYFISSTEAYDKDKGFYLLMSMEAAKSVNPLKDIESLLAFPTVYVRIRQRCLVCIRQISFQNKRWLLSRLAYYQKRLRD